MMVLHQKMGMIIETTGNRIRHYVIFMVMLTIRVTVRFWLGLC